jgi:hypothetical protein
MHSFVPRAQETELTSAPVRLFALQDDPPFRVLNRVLPPTVAPAVAQTVALAHETLESWLVLGGIAEVAQAPPKFREAKRRGPLE